MIYRPVRERSPQEILRIAHRGLQETGFEDLSLLSLSSGDYSCLLPLVKELMARAANHHVALSFSSLRADGIVCPLMEEIKKVRKTSFTIAPEAGSQRMRDVINKGLSEEQILQAVGEIYKAGWNLIKLYFMIGLPGEQESDIEAIVNLSKKIARLAPPGRGGNVLNVSVATFVPKSHTPFQWLPQLELEQAKQKIDYIRNRFPRKRIKVKWNKPEASWLEGIFSRGDRKLTDVLIDAWKEGARFDSWSEHLNLDIWRSSFARHGRNPEFYLYKQKHAKEILPWDHIHSGVSKVFLLDEWRRAQRGETTPDCRKHCSDCGVCKDLSVSPVLFNESAGMNTSSPAQGSLEGRIRRFRIHFTKRKRGRYLSHLEVVRLFIRGFRRAGIPMVYSNGYYPMPKVSFATALPVGVESMDEVADLSLYDNGNIVHRLESVNREFPPGIEVFSIEEISTREHPPQVKESAFEVTVPGSVHKKDILHFLELPAYPVTQKRKKGERTIDIRSQVKELRLLSDGQIEMVVRHDGGPSMNPSEIMESICSLSASQSEGMRIVKTKSVLV
jgi:radical SAM-linked protein